MPSPYENNVKFLPNVEVVLTATDEVAQIGINENGTGIPETLRARVFEPFYNVDTSSGANNRRVSGFGLSIVAGIVHGHGSEIELEDNRSA